MSVPDTVEQPDQVEVTPPQETNLSKLKKDKIKLERELRKIKEKSNVTQAVLNAGVQEDSWIEGKQMPEILSSFAQQIKADLESEMEVKLESRFKQYKQDHLYSYMQAETGAHYGRVVTDSAIKKLLEKEPEMEIILEALKDTPEKYAQIVYKKCARMEEEDRKFLENKNRLDIAASRPGRRYAQPIAPPSEEPFDIYSMKPGDKSSYEYMKSLQKQIRY